MEQESRGWTQCGALATLQAKQMLWNYELGKNGSRKPRDFLRRENGDVEWTAEPLGVSSLRRRREEEKLRNSAEGTEQSGWRERLLLCLTARKRVREGAGRTGAFLLGPQCTVASSSSAGLGILWGRHGAQTEGRKVQKRTNIKSEFLAAPGDDDSFWWQQRLISWAASHRVAQRQHAWNKLFWCPVVDFIEFFSERAKSSLHFEAFKATFLKSSRTSPITLHLHGIHEQTDLPPTHSNPSKDTSLPRVLSSHTETLLLLTLQRERRKAVISSRFLSLSRCVSP